MAKLPAVANTTAFQVEEKYDVPSIKDKRGYLGMSGLGDNCMRRLWYGFHHSVIHYEKGKGGKYKYAPNEGTIARVIRLFERGDWEEHRIIKDLESIGVKVWGEQMALSAAYGHICGHIDGLGIGFVEAPKAIHLLEFKTANERNFSAMMNKGIQQSHPVYYGQIQLYMHHLIKQHKIKAKRCMFIATNKNTEARLYQRFEYDREYAQYLIDRGVEVIRLTTPPEKEFRPTSFQCKWCNFKEICHNDKSAGVNCRTCKHASPLIKKGEWKCVKHNKIFVEPIPCKSYRPVI